MFKELENTLSKILQKLENQEILLEIALNSLKSRKEVSEFLGISTKTIENYLKDGRFQENIHYFHDQKGHIVFVPNEILNFKKNQQNQKFEIKKIEKQVHPSASKFIKSGLKNVG